jgi:hypothetical protein
VNFVSEETTAGSIEDAEGVGGGENLRDPLIDRVKDDAEGIDLAVVRGSKCLRRA